MFDVLPKYIFCRDVGALILEMERQTPHLVHIDCASKLVLDRHVQGSDVTRERNCALFLTSPFGGIRPMKDIFKEKITRLIPHCENDNLRTFQIDALGTHQHVGAVVAQHRIVSGADQESENRPVSLVNGVKKKAKARIARKEKFTRTMHKSTLNTESAQLGLEQAFKFLRTKRTYRERKVRDCSRALKNRKSVVRVANRVGEGTGKSRCDYGTGNYFL